MTTGCVFIIAPGTSLAATAERVGVVLAAKLEPEMSGRFEEFPAFVGATSDLGIILLGPPQSEYDIRDSPTQDYALQLAPLAQVQPNRYLELHQQLIAGGVEILAFELPPNNSFKPNPLRGLA